MGDSGEGLIDNEARIQERMEELQRNRTQARNPGAVMKNPELTRQIESLELARKEMARSVESTVHEGRRNQLTAALADIDRRIAELQSAYGSD
jgi:hypothetical protein